MIEYNATCATCAHRDAEDRCTERRSAWHGWSVARKKGNCHFYQRRATRPELLVLLAGGLSEPGEGES